MSKEVIIKSNRYGINLILDSQIPFQELLGQISDKFKETGSFFRDAKMAVSFEGRELTMEQEQDIADTIMANSSVRIVSIVDNNRELEEQMRRSVEAYLETAATASPERADADQKQRMQEDGTALDADIRAKGDITMPEDSSEELPEPQDADVSAGADTRQETWASEDAGTQQETWASEAADTRQETWASEDADTQQETWASEAADTQQETWVSEETDTQQEAWAAAGADTQQEARASAEADSQLEAWASAGTDLPMDTAENSEIPAEEQAEEVIADFYKGSLRSGQVIESASSVTVVGDVNPGAKVISMGNIVILGALKGNAQAGAGGNRNSFIFALEMRPIQLQIGDLIAKSPDREKAKKRGKKKDKDNLGVYSPQIAVARDGNICIEPMKKGSLNHL